MKERSVKGFTLIELLVVVAIIGILATVIIASLSGAKTKAVDARIKSTMASIRNQGELFYSEHGSFNNGYNYTYMNATEATCGSWFGGLFDPAQTQSAFRLLKDAAYLGSGGQWGDTRCYLGARGESYAILVPLRSGGYWCVDSNGASRSATVAGLVFNQGQIVCP